jgi:alpha-tubulin suppressor-like RCC1 family protein
VRWWWLFVLAGCGRIGFAQAPGDGVVGGGDGAVTGDVLREVADVSPAVACGSDVDCHGCGACGADQICHAFDFSRFSLGHRSSLGVAADGTYWGWGLDENGALDIDGGPYAIPQHLADLDSLPFVAMGYSFGAGLGSDGSIWNWQGSMPSKMQVGSDTGWTDLQASWDWGCARKPDGTLWCWGNDYLANLGNGMTGVYAGNPIQVPIPAIASYSIDSYNGCAITTGGALYCWGDNSALATGQATGSAVSPAQVGTASDWTDVISAGGATCAREGSDAPVQCWGQSYDNGTSVTSATPVAVDAHTDWTLVRGSFGHTCGIRADHTLWCWGDNAEGQLGLGDFAVYISPTQLSLPGDVDDVVTGGHVTCARVAGAWWCWGRNDEGQLGTGMVGANTPTPFERCSF